MSGGSVFVSERVTLYLWVCLTKVKKKVSLGVYLIWWCLHYKNWVALVSLCFLYFLSWITYFLVYIYEDFIHILKLQEVMCFYVNNIIVVLMELFCFFVLNWFFILILFLSLKLSKKLRLKLISILV